MKTLNKIKVYSLVLVGTFALLCTSISAASVTFTGYGQRGITQGYAATGHQYFNPYTQVTIHDRNVYGYSTVSCSGGSLTAGQKGIGTNWTKTISNINGGTVRTTANSYYFQ